MAKASTNNILKRLNSVEGYHPFTASTFSDWSIEAGDIISVSRDGTSYKSPVSSSNLVWKGQPQVRVSSTGTKAREAVSVMSAKEYSGSARSGNSYRSGVYRGRYAAQLEGHIQESEKRVLISVDNLDKKLGTRIDQTDTKVSMSVGTLKYSKIEKYASKSKFPATGKAGTLYVAKDTGQSYAWVNPPGIYYVVTPNSDGEVNYMKVGEIAIAFNEQTGKTEAKLDADVIYAGKVNGKLVTLQDLELPDWMGATDEGIVALQGNFGTLNAKVANIEKITAKAITTDNFSALSSLVSKGTFASIDTGALYIRPLAGMGRLSVANGFNAATISQDGNDYTITLVRFNGSTQTLNFSRATTLSGEWGSNRLFTVTASPQGNTFYTRLVSSIAPEDIVWGSSGYTGTATIHATVNGSSTRVEAGKVAINAYDAYKAGFDEGESSASSVSSNEIGGSVGGVTPQSAGTSPISGRYNVGYANLPSVPSYLLLTLSCRGTTRQAYIMLGG